MTAPTTGVGTVAGTKFYMGTSETIASPDDYVEIGDISNMGDIAEQYAGVTIESIGSGDSYDLKGVRKFPNFTLVMNRNDSDAGQIALKAAASAARGTLYNFKILEVDGGTAVWKGEVFGYGPTYGSNQSVRGVKSEVSIRPDTLTITAV